MDNFLQDLRYSGRIFLKNRQFTLIVVLSLALGIGITSAIFSMIYAMLIDPFPYRDSRSIAAVTFDDPLGNRARASTGWICAAHAYHFPRYGRRPVHLPKLS